MHVSRLAPLLFALVAAGCSSNVIRIRGTVERTDVPYVERDSKSRPIYPEADWSIAKGRELLKGHLAPVVGAVVSATATFTLTTYNANKEKLDFKNVERRVRGTTDGQGHFELEVPVPDGADNGLMGWDYPYIALTGEGPGAPDPLFVQGTLVYSQKPDGTWPEFDVLVVVRPRSAYPAK